MKNPFCFASLFPLTGSLLLRKLRRLTAQSPIDKLLNDNSLFLLKTNIDDRSKDTVYVGTAILVRLTEPLNAYNIPSSFKLNMVLQIKMKLNIVLASENRNY